MNHDAIIIRRASFADVEVIARFNGAMALETESITLDASTVIAGVKAILSDPTKGLYYLAELNGEVVGQTMFTYEWSDWRNGCFWWIQSVYVVEHARRQGVFRALYHHIRKEAKADPTVCGLRLYVHRDNTKAQTTYADLGMSVTHYLLCEEDWANG